MNRPRRYSKPCAREGCTVPVTATTPYRLSRQRFCSLACAHTARSHANFDDADLSEAMHRLYALGVMGTTSRCQPPLPAQKGQTMNVRQLAIGILFCLGVATSAAAQTLPDACMPATSNVVNSAKSFTVTQLVPATVVASATDPTLVPYIVDGMAYQVDSGPRVEIVPKPVGGAPCVGGSKPGWIPYMFQVAAGTGKGQHNLTTFVWFFDRTIDPVTGNVIVGTTKKEASLVTPFVAIDPVYTGPAIPPANVRIWR